ncbi:alcohol dehydrogenase catalytic domain-containing protein, partial [Klebsiella pneumoniae]|uniref:alcohol dehydrogenase catalytic domain-containing protein n=1 Tax=Klebsiella pneumoniae TaxID=573 RepID=UPI0034D1A4DA
PKGLGVEGSGRIAALGEGVTDFAVGDRVAWIYAPGSYAERLVASTATLVHVPDAIDDRTAAATMMQGLTASH